MLRPAVVGLVCVLLGTSTGQDHPVTALETGPQAAYEKASVYHVDLAAVRDGGQLKTMSEPKLLDAGGPGLGGTLHHIRPSTRIGWATRPVPPAPDLRKSTWVGVVVLRL